MVSGHFVCPAFSDAKFQTCDGPILTGHFRTLIKKTFLILNVWAVPGPRTILVVYHVSVLEQTFY